MLRNTGKIVLGLMGTLSVMVLAAGSASAAIEVRNENGNFHCVAVTQPTAHTVDGGCLLHASSVVPARLYQHITTPVVAEVNFSTCNNEFHARINEGGTGFILNQVLTNVTPGSCGITGCDEVEPSHADRTWPVRIEETAGQEFLHLVFCTRTLAAGEGFGTSCEVRLPITRVGHTYTFGPVTETPCLNNPPGAIIELSGQWQTETGGPGEVTVGIVHP